MSQEPAKTPGEPADATTPEQHPDDLIVAPRGTSRTRFVMTFLIVLLLLTTFTVSGPILDTLGLKDSVTANYMSWKGPDGTPRKLSYADFMAQKRSFAPFKGMLFPGEDRDPSDDETAYFLVLDEAASAAGVRVTPTDVTDMVKRSFQSSEQYRQTARVYRMSLTDFETMLRRVMRVQRYRDLVSAAYLRTDPAEIQKQWMGRHQEFAFDYVEVPTTSVDAEARALAPSSDELKAWFETVLTQPERDRYKTKDAAAAEIAAYVFEGGSPDALFAKYPRPADYDAEKDARTYHEGFGFYRFFDASRAATGSPIKPFEEVKEQVLKEAPILAALEDWRADMAKRESEGATIDLAAEALALGLPYRNQPEALSTEKWLALEIPWMTSRLAAPIVEDSFEGQLPPAVRLAEKAMVIARVTKREAARMPEFSEIESQVRDIWVQRKAKELGLAKLTALRESFGAPRDAADPASEKVYETSADQFVAKAKEAGFEGKRRDFQERFARLKPGETPPPVDAYLRGAAAAYTSKEGTVLPPEASADGANLYLVRVAGVRDPDASKISVLEYQQLARQGGSSPFARMMFMNSTFQSRAFFQEQYGLELAPWKTDADSPN